ncbi:ubiquitin-conjugating enzyme/RWD-like protein [Bombardia bombarda]|uniref:Ubiquitin-conjugating enzyme/RWD-like protein n=1 Tax=Bombardia bombarda TaxID=252184 RepID=A0AA39WIR5_9PEZI|nr:ubiquitin-conjugating enzyme/RWD-like protein [Bombardia bombarda]
MAATTPKFKSKSPTIRRILREAHEISSSPSSDCTATPLESDLFEWHFTLRGPPNSSYAGGIYHGRIVLPTGYPLRPPSFRFVTPSGRFETNREICLSISGHHEETWQPAWGVRTALVALRSFMETDANGQLGGLETTEAVRRRLAAESGAFKCGVCCSRTNAEIMEDKVAVEVEVPKELKMGWRDEMKAEAEAAKEGGEGLVREDAESDELAEGFVQTVPLVRIEVPAAAEVDTAMLPAQPGQGVPQPTRTVPLPDPQRIVPAYHNQHQATVQRQLAQRVSDDEVPLWIDRLIVILGILLSALVLKVFFT